MATRDPVEDKAPRRRRARAKAPAAWTQSTAALTLALSRNEERLRLAQAWLYFACRWVPGTPVSVDAVTVLAPVAARTAGLTLQELLGAYAGTEFGWNAVLVARGHDSVTGAGRGVACLHEVVPLFWIPRMHELVQSPAAVTAGVSEYARAWMCMRHTSLGLSWNRLRLATLQWAAAIATRAAALNADQGVPSGFAFNPSAFEHALVALVGHMVYGNTYTRVAASAMPELEAMMRPAARRSPPTDWECADTRTGADKWHAVRVHEVCADEVHAPALFTSGMNRHWQVGVPCAPDDLTWVAVCVYLALRFLLMEPRTSSGTLDSHVSVGDERNGWGGGIAAAGSGKVGNAEGGDHVVGGEDDGDAVVVNVDEAVCKELVTVNLAFDLEPEVLLLKHDALDAVVAAGEWGRVQLLLPVTPQWPWSV